MIGIINDVAMQTLSRKNIIKIVSNSRSKQNENLEAYAGSGKDKRLVLSPGLKIKHKNTNLVYTIDKVDINGSKISLTCSIDGKVLVIPSKEFKNYERQ